MPDDYLSERAVDVKDIGLRLLRNLLGVEEPERTLERDSVLVAEELTLSDLGADRARAPEGHRAGDRRRHLARLDPRQVVRDPDRGRRRARRPRRCTRATRCIVDGNSGVVYVNPPPDVVREYDRLDREYRAFNRELEPLRELPAETTDGRRVNLYANIGLIGDLHLRASPRRRRHRSLPHRVPVPHLPRLPGRGGAGRSSTRGSCAAWRASRSPSARSTSAPTSIPRYLQPGARGESVPRLALDPHLARDARALQDAAARHPARRHARARAHLLLPMISSLEEIRRVKELLEEAKDELRRQGSDFDPSVPIGMMIEVPSAVALASHLIREVDFFSHRHQRPDPVPARGRPQQPQVAPLYEPLHPAVLRAIHDTVQAAQGRRQVGRHVRRDGVRSAVHARAARPRARRPLDGPVLHPGRQAHHPLGAVRARCATLARDVLGLATVKEVKGYLFDGMRSLGIIELMEMYH